MMLLVMKHNKFRAYLVEHEINQEEVAKVLDISRTAFTYKLSGRIRFSIDDINKLQKAYKLTDKQVKQFFLE